MYEYDGASVRRLMLAHGEQIAALIVHANAYCAVIDSISRTTQVAFLTALEPLLASLYTGFIALPAPEEWYGEGDDEDLEHASPDEVAATQQSISLVEFLSMRNDQPGLSPMTETHVSSDEEMDVYRRIEVLLDHHAVYRECFDPYDLEDPLQGSLSDDLASLYALLRNYIPLCSSGRPLEVAHGAWNLRFDFDTHGGQHLINALRAIYFLLRFRRSSWDDDAWEEGRLVPFEDDA